MPSLLIALLMVASAWYAWRRNPMFSARRTLHFLLALVLSVAAAVLLFYAAITLTEHQSKEVQLASIFGAVFVATIGLIWIIVTVSTPKNSPIPANTKLATVHRRKVIPWLKRTAWSLLVCGVCAAVPYVFPGNAPGWAGVVQFVGLFFGAWVVGLGGIMLAAGYIGGRNLDRALTATEANAWIHWTYTAAEWKAWSDVQVTRTRASIIPYDPRKHLKAALGISILFILVCLAVIDALPPWARLLIGLAVSAILIGGIFLAEGAGSSAPAKLARTLAAAPAEVYLGPDGIFADGTYNPWISPGIFLLEAAMAPATEMGGNARNLVFRFEKINPGYTASTTHITQCVLIPPNASAGPINQQLALLQRELDRIARTARVHIVQQAAVESIPSRV